MRRLALYEEANYQKIDQSRLPNFVHDTRALTRAINTTCAIGTSTSPERNHHLEATPQHPTYRCCDEV
jgi:hypothetical protein